MTFLSLASYRNSHTKKRFFPVCLSVTLILSIEKHFFTQNFPNMDNIKQIMLNIDSHLKEWTDSKYIILNIGNEASQGQFFISFFFFPPAHKHITINRIIRNILSQGQSNFRCAFTVHMRNSFIYAILLLDFG